MMIKDQINFSFLMITWWLEPLDCESYMIPTKLKGWEFYPSIDQMVLENLLALKEIKKYSKQMHKSKIILDSIYDVRNFYKNSGFIPISDVYSKVGIPHVKMIFYL